MDLTAAFLIGVILIFDMTLFFVTSFLLITFFGSLFFSNFRTILSLVLDGLLGPRLMQASFFVPTPWLYFQPPSPGRKLYATGPGI